ncbi:MAG: hypothetical protein H6585_01190 [Flavobacteriales bacterium]|nr:hypothetical protein [Flavobacteriales bacterium]MCB9446942.1 hypothetical protein [Flavobacteriales bacterium]
MEHECLECGEPFSGRSDKKYCCDACRNLYNNRVNLQENRYVRKINGILARNRRILAALHDLPNARLYRSDLLRCGLEPAYFTGYSQNEDGTFLYRCYEYTYVIDKDREVHIGKSTDHTNGLQQVAGFYTAIAAP